jgi:hypothetical protein
MLRDLDCVQLRTFLPIAERPLRVRSRQAAVGGYNLQARGAQIVSYPGSMSCGPSRRRARARSAI